MSRYNRILANKVNEKPKPERPAEPIETMQPEQPEEGKMLLRHQDPRPDIRYDHQLWVNLLTNAWHWDRQMWGILHGIRCYGARLAKTADGFKLLSGEIPEAEWEGVKQKWLAPVRDKLIKLFTVTHAGRVIETEDEDVPELFRT